MELAKQPRQFEGTVVSDAMAKTCVVVVERWKMHPKYRKAFRMRRRYKVHDPEHTAHVGDQVRFVECRPISKEKRWRLVDVIGHASAPASAELVA
ncbi:30S ribosomal protein S17 [Candidatus Uhrbacteria bacterium]|nr:30S ribosomal protein S17 [Candidatus Uhrbacteria bacterium]